MAVGITVEGVDTASVALALEGLGQRAVLDRDSEGAADVVPDQQALSEDLDGLGDNSEAILCSEDDISNNSQIDEFYSQLAAPDHVYDPENESVAARSCKDAGLIKNAPHALLLIRSCGTPVPRTLFDRLLGSKVGSHAFVLRVPLDILPFIL